MAKMIPSTYSPSIKSDAEKKIFRWFQKMEWQHCVILHSLEMAEHVDNIFGEIDFVIIADEGVMCVEVKGGVVERVNGQWTFTNRWGHKDTKPVGPYNQAQGNEQSLRKNIQDRLPQNDPLARCQFACCVMAPDCSIRVDGDPKMKVKGRLDFIPEITFDVSMGPEDLPEYLDNCFKYWKENMKEHNRRTGNRISDEDKERLVELLRGDFALVPPLSDILDRTEDMLCSLTDEQYVIMQNTSSNKRMLINGPAGTGKTLLAMDQCRRYRAEGKRVAYICYNNLIARSVRNQFKAEEKDIDVFTFPQLLMNTCGITYSEDEERSDKYFKEELPELFINEYAPAMSDNDKYDVIVVDEGQDLMNANYTICLGEYLIGGLDKGRWSIYYDRNQNIFGNYQELEEIAEDLEDRAACFNLSVNCRNTSQIANGNWHTTNIDQAKIMKAEGEMVQYNKYSSKVDERKMLFQEIRRLRTEGIRNSDIVILSPFLPSNEKSCFFDADIPKDIGMIRFNERNNFKDDSFIKAYTVQSYKGMEAKVILYIDIQGFVEDKDRLMNYVAMSRACTYLELFYPKELENDRQQMMLNTLKDLR